MNDGVTISIQASSYHYSQPEKNIPYNEYSAFEICMNKKDVRTPPLKKYIDNSGIIAYVPIIDIINEIQMHDGLKDNQ